MAPLLWGEADISVVLQGEGRRKKKRRKRKRRREKKEKEMEEEKKEGRQRRKDRKKNCFTGSSFECDIFFYSNLI